MVNERLEKKLKDLPKEPGVYFHKSADGEIIYVGKAAVLRNRVRQYFQKSRARDPKTEALVAEIVDTDWMVVDSELEALFLEAEMIRRYMPRYNILLRDDKAMSYIRIDYDSDFPTVTTTRRPLDDGARYYGPYFSNYQVRQALKMLRRVFPFATRRIPGQKRATLHYHLGLDPGLEEGRTSLEDYRANLRKLIAIIEGKRKKIVRELERDMKRQAKAQEYEAAAKTRNQMYLLEGLSKQVIFSDKEFLDISKDHALNQLAEILGLYQEEVSQDLHSDKMQGAGEQRSEPYKGYGERAAEPATPQIAEKATRVAGSAGKQGRLLQSLRRIEGYDISHMSGTNVVASMVVFTNGVSNKAEYRKFKTKIDHNNDFYNMHETLGRRLSEKNIKAWGCPDLILIDGGKGQLDAAIRARDERGQSKIPFIGLAKREEQIVIKKRVTPESNEGFSNVMLNREAVTKLGGYCTETEDFILVNLPHHAHVVKLLQRIRDESHRFAVSYHSTLKQKGQTVSLLDEIPGIGPSTRKKLIKSFGSLRGVRGASLDELADAVGPAKAKVLDKYLGTAKP
ncbi:MAG TPA: excinuclease ABC subunit UvrC [Candidatus Saccharimonadales bacterium]|nr:excinuclease ABC subunit UvrC [Candidatus Saccharimonadales bacterium]